MSIDVACRYAPESEVESRRPAIVANSIVSSLHRQKGAEDDNMACTVRYSPARMMEIEGEPGAI